MKQLQDFLKTHYKVLHKEGLVVVEEGIFYPILIKDGEEIPGWDIASFLEGNPILNLEWIELAEEALKLSLETFKY